MNKRKKRILALSLLLLIFVIMALAGIRYLPINKYLKVQSGSGNELISTKPALQQTPNTLFFDMEVPPGKEMPGDIYKGIAHSGQYSGKSFGKNSFGVLIERQVDQIGVENLGAVALSCWVYVFPTSNEINGAIVFAASNNVGVNVCWKGVYLSGAGIPQGKWFKISGQFDLGDVTFKPGYKIQVYFWNNSRSDILTDDYLIVFGKEKPRRGDSAMVDMTRGNAFIPGFNIPPFQNQYLTPVDIGNRNAFSLILDKAGKVGEVGWKDHLIAGNFISKKSGSDDILLLKPGGIPELYSFCTETRSFRKVVVNTADRAIEPDISFVTPGRFLDGRSDQLFVQGKNGMLLGSFETSGDPCSTSTIQQAKFNLLWKSSGGLHEEVKIFPSTKLVCGDFNGDKLSEILAVNENGSWAMLKFSNRKEGGKWEVITTGGSAPMTAWNSAEKRVKITSGRFLKGINRDVLLTVFSDQQGFKSGFMLHSFNPSGNNFISHFSGKQNQQGKTIGRDTLKTTDVFYIGDFNGDGEHEVFRYNRDWRYDLKQISFNDTTFRVIGNVDFRGYPEDQNPKYYEHLRLVRFVDSGLPEFLIIAGNSKEYPYLPNTIQCYSFTQRPIK